MDRAEGIRLIKRLIAECQNGYVKAVKAIPGLEQFVYDQTKFLDTPDRDWKTRIWYLTNDLTEYVKCEVCGKPVTKNVFRRTNPCMRTCCASCKNLDPIAQEKAKRTNVKHGGVEYVGQREDVKAKAAKTRNSKTPEERERQRQNKSKAYHKSVAKGNRKHSQRKSQATCKKLYGKKFYAETAESRQKASATAKKPENIKKRATARKLNFYARKIAINTLVAPLFSAEEYACHEKREHFAFRWKCLECGQEFEVPVSYSLRVGDNRTYVPARCEHCHPKIVSDSLEEKEFAEWISSILPSGWTVVHRKEENLTLIRPRQVDLIVKEKNEIRFAVEFDGVKWHAIDQSRQGIYRQLNKTRLCEKIGVPLIHVFEDDWNADKNSVAALIKSYVSGKIEIGDSDIVKVDRAKISKPAIPIGWKVIGETVPEIRMRKSPMSGEIYAVPDCGELILEKVL